MIVRRLTGCFKSRRDYGSTSVSPHHFYGQDFAGRRSAIFFLFWFLLQLLFYASLFDLLILLSQLQLVWIQICTSPKPTPQQPSSSSSTHTHTHTHTHIYIYIYITVSVRGECYLSHTSIYQWKQWEAARWIWSKGNESKDRSTVGFIKLYLVFIFYLAVQNIVMLVCIILCWEQEYFHWLKTLLGLNFNPAHTYMFVVILSHLSTYWKSVYWMQLCFLLLVRYRILIATRTHSHQCIHMYIYIYIYCLPACIISGNDNGRKHEARYSNNFFLLAILQDSIKKLSNAIILAGTCLIFAWFCSDEKGGKSTF